MDYQEEMAEIQAGIERQNARRIAVLKRTLRELAALPQTPALQADMNSLEHWIDELGGDGRTGAHRAIRDSGTRARHTCEGLTGDNGDDDRSDKS